MLKKISIKNFQSHLDSQLEFINGVNVITGNSDSGKSAIIRALRWLVYNKPTGDSFRSYWGGDTTCEIELENGSIVTRVRDNKGNSYKLNGDLFRAFKNDIPEDILKILNMDGINLQQQLDGPFLLNLTPGEVASYFNHIVNLDAIDTSIYNVQRWLASEQSDLSHEENTKKQLDSELIKYSYLDEAEKLVLEAENLDRDIDTSRSTIRELERTLTSINNIALEIDNLQPYLALEPLVSEALKQSNALETAYTRVQNLDNLCVDLLNYEFNIKNLEAYIIHEQSVDKLLEDFKTYKAFVVRYDNLNNLTTELKDQVFRIGKVQQVLMSNEKLFMELMPDTCPLCGR